MYRVTMEMEQKYSWKKTDTVVFCAVSLCMCVFVVSEIFPAV